MNIPYSVETRPDTGLYNARLAIWLFLASEAMLFGGFFSAYTLIRSGSPTWPEHDMNVPLAGFNTVLLITSSMTMVTSWASLRAGNWRGHRLFLMATVVLALAFVGVKSIEYAEHLRAGEGPTHDTFFALYYAMTGLHLFHIVAGVVVMLYFLGPGASLWRRNSAQFANRIESTGLYWHFVDMVWIFLFPLLYLI